MTPLRTLQGIRIAAFTQFLLGPAAVQHLADLGADVIKVETPGTGAWERHWAGADCFPGGVSAFFMLANRNLRSVVLDLKSEAGHEAALKLIASSDVVVENFRPGVMDRLGLSYDAARTVRPDIIYASASGYGADSPFRDLPGQDLLIQALSGLGWLTGRRDQEPVSAGAAVVDQHGAALLAMGLLAALLHRERTGEGQRIEVTMLQAALDLVTEPVVYRLNGARIERPVEPVADTFHAAPYGYYRTRDGHVAISMTPIAKLRQALDGATELEGLEDPAIAFTERDRIRARLGPLIEKRSTDELVALLRSHGVWCTPVNTLDAALADPALRHLQPVLEMEHPRAGTVKVLVHPVRYSAGEPELRYTPPEVGQHTQEVLLELGYPVAEHQ
jgi:crotonobetainyl-CoA:carnitine CoA-transferase CaiB-like acyl-CoA transferase